MLTTVVTPPPPEGCGHDVVMDKETTTTTTTTTRREARAEARTSRIQKVRIKISGQWYDCSRWAAAHPGGARFLHAVDGKDVTNLFYALHSFGANGSTRAVELLQRLPTCNAPEAEKMESEEHENEKVCAPFDALRRKLADEGWFERSPREEAIALGGVAALCICGTLIARVGSASPLAQILATLFIGLGMQQAGWLGHDYIHGRGWWCNMMRPFAGVINGHSTEWWTQKHSMHHSFTNDETLDEDIMIEPVYYLRTPMESEREDSPLRRFQHLYGFPLYALTFALWRVDSVKCIVKRKDAREAIAVLANYLWLATLPPAVSIGAVLFAGFFVGSIVTATHQSEEITTGKHLEFVEAQFKSTRDAESENAFIEWLWGGMQYQLEHHLFPSMPRYRYRELRPLLQQWAAENNYGAFIIRF